MGGKGTEVGLRTLEGGTTLSEAQLRQPAVLEGARGLLHPSLPCGEASGWPEATSLSLGAGAQGLPPPGRGLDAKDAFLGSIRRLFPRPLYEEQA